MDDSVTCRCIFFIFEFSTSFTKATMKMVDKIYTAVVIVILTCSMQVICKSTFANMENRKCQDISPHLRLVLDKLQSIEDKVNMMGDNGKYCVLNCFISGIK